MRPFFILFIVICILPFNAWSAPDVKKVARLQNTQPSAQIWRQADGQVRLQPGKEHIFLLAAQSSLRIEPVNIEKIPVDVRLFIDNGNGLSREVALIDAGDGRLAWRNTIDKPLLARLFTPATALKVSSFNIAVSHSRQSPREPLYRKEINLSLPAIHIEQTAPITRHKFFSLSAGETTALELNGPCRLRLESRVDWSDPLLSLRAFNRLTIQVDELAPHTFDTYPRLENGAVTIAEFPDKFLGNLELSYLEIPSGKHRLRFRSSLSSYLRPILECSERFLFPSLNANRDSQQQNRSIQSVHIEQLSKATDVMVHDPLRPQGALEALELLNLHQAAIEWEKNDLQTEVKQIKGRWTSYRDLIPTNYSGNLKLAYFPQKS